MAPPAPVSVEGVQRIAEALNDLIAIDAHGLLRLGGSANIPAELTFKCASVSHKFVVNMLIAM